MNCVVFPCTDTAMLRVPKDSPARGTTLKSSKSDNYKSQINLFIENLWL